MSLKNKIENAYEAGKNAVISGKSIYFDPYRNMGAEYSKEQSDWHRGYESVKK